jgi:predicted ATPase
VGSKPETGLSLLSEALEAGSATPAGGLTSEFQVSMGQLLLAQSPANAPQAESLFQQAVQSAQAADAPMLELRAALRLSSLWHAQGKDEEARELLSAAYSKMTEGFTTADMQQASALLAAMPE